MANSLPLIQVDREVYAKFNACIHCGLCLPACPTYVETFDEADSPRGRIHLMKAIVDGRIEVSTAGDTGDMAFEHLDRCLVCRACETACPSGVQYHDLIEAVRPQVAEARLGPGRGMRSRLLQWTVKHIFPYAGRAAWAMKPLRLLRRLGLGGMVERMAPGALSAVDARREQLRGGAEGHAADTDLPAFTPARRSSHAGAGGERGGTAAAIPFRGSVILLRGCVGSVVSPGVNAACARVLAENGFDVHVLPEEPCCGAMAAHANDPAGAVARAKQLVETLERTQGRGASEGSGEGRGAAGGIDFFVSPIAGCGAQLKALHHVLAHEGGGGGDWPARAAAIVRKMRNVTEMLMQAGIRPPHSRLERRVTYHDPCHLIHAQRISDAPRQILALIPGLTLVKLTESDMCCGAAGTYNMNQPELAARLGRRKADHILATGATELITANVGCALQITRHLRDRGSPIPVRHVVEILDEAYRAEPTRRDGVASPR